ncbi:SDR family NAD(P)-dependent oxidoreductase [Candidatus Binatus sp.]|uniref:SDR family NAD(P)-dependent oxidoreductase n=1 Tax=Candidatus Binatus sp. TaxID=2811406 RepID=UPI003C61FD21
MAANNGKQEFGARSSAYDVVAGHDLSGRTIIVTGANTGIGEWTARALAGAGARVIFACRQPASGNAAVARTRDAHPGCKAEFAQLDLASFASITRFTDHLDADRIDALICNAGLVRTSWAETEEGFERTVGVCHIGHFLLARLLMPRMLACAAPRVVMVSSLSHRSPAKLDFDRLPMTRENFRGMTAYGQAKLCNVLMAKSLQSRYGGRGLVACALHPGTLVTTDIGRNSKIFGALMKLVSPFTKSPSQGAATSVYATVHEPASELAGQYLQNCQITPSSSEANDPTVADRLWTASEQWIAAAQPPAWP